MRFKKTSIRLAVASALALGIPFFACAQGLTGANGQYVTDAQISSYLATNPTPDQIAAQAAALGLTVAQVSGAMAAANYGGDQAQRDAAISSYLNTNTQGYSVGASGQIAKTPTVIPSGSLGGTYPGVVSKTGQPYTVAQIQSFFAHNPDNNELAAAIKELNLSHEQAARALAIGRGYDPDNMNPSLKQMMLGSAVNLVSGPGSMVIHGSVLLTEEEVKGFFASNPTNEQIAHQAALMYMSLEDINAALHKGRGDKMEQYLQIVDAVNGMPGYAWQDGHIVQGSGEKIKSPSGFSVFADQALVVQPDSTCFADTKADARPGCLSNKRWLDVKSR